MRAVRGRSARRFLLIPLASILFAIPGVAHALPSAVHSPLVKFERDSQGAKPNGFTSADSSIAHLADSLNENLAVTDLGDTIGQGLSIRNDDESRLLINFDVPIRKLSLVFGNDDACCSSDGDVAILQVFRGGAMVDSSTVVLNRNDLPDQTIGVKGTTFRRAEFFYASGDTPINLIETVDNIRISPACTIKGTNRHDRLRGNVQSNSICGFDGRDRINARGKNDFVHGGAGKDRVKGGPGGDTLMGGSGGDVIRARDGVDGNDTVYGGGGNDICFLDALDNQLGCEDVRVPV